MGYRVLGNTEDLFRGYEPRKGLEGPFIKGANRIVYYDPKEGQYWDPKTDFYLSTEEVEYLDRELMKMLAR
jgi:hypothetical protein